MFHLQNVHFSAGGKEIVSAPDLNLQGQNKVLLLGPSGCGKTTLMQLMAGLRRAQQGVIAFDGTDIQNLKGPARDQFRGQKFGFVFQNFHLLKHLIVIDNIRLARLGAKLSPDETKISALLEALNLSSKAMQKSSSLSQGEAQRVAIARAVANDPAVIFADEPTSALDDTNTDQVMGLLESQAEKTGAMLIVATHDSRIKERFENVVHIKDGKIL